MTYEQFEAIGMEEGAPYALCKLAWAWEPWRKLPLRERPLRIMFRNVLNQLKTKEPKSLEALHFVSQFQIEPGALEDIAQKWLAKANEAVL